MMNLNMTVAELMEEAKKLSETWNLCTLVKDLQLDKMEKVIKKYGVSEESIAFVNMMKVAVPMEKYPNINWVFDRLMEA